MCYKKKLIAARLLPVATNGNGSYDKETVDRIVNKLESHLEEIGKRPSAVYSQVAEDQSLKNQEAIEEYQVYQELLAEIKGVTWHKMVCILAKHATDDE